MILVRILFTIDGKTKVLLFLRQLPGRPFRNLLKGHPYQRALASVLINFLHPSPRQCFAKYKCSRSPSF